MIRLHIHTLIFLPLLFAHALPSLEIRDASFNVENKTFTFQGINWFGFNNKQTMLDGLWAGGLSSATDFRTILYTIKLLGFNSIRLPFTFSDLRLATQDKSIPCFPMTKDDVIKRSTDKKPYGKFIITKGSVCNTYLPNGITKDRFLWVIEECIKADLYVVIDYHPMNTEPIDNIVPQWKSLWNDIVKRPGFNERIKKRIILDLFNEPDSMSLSWRKMTDIYVKIMDAIYDPKTSPYFMVEGTGQTNHNINWGDGFASDPVIIQRYKIESAKPFFDAILNKPYINNIIISPHVYGPTVSLSTRSSTGTELFKRLDESFGYLARAGYCNKSKCHKFPIIIGEFGSTFEDPRDLAHLEDFAKWMGKSLKQYNWMYWAYNQNSGDTGGIVKNNWQDIDWKKISWLESRMKLSS